MSVRMYSLQYLILYCVAMGFYGAMYLAFVFIAPFLGAAKSGTEAGTSSWTLWNGYRSYAVCIWIRIALQVSNMSSVLACVHNMIAVDLKECNRKLGHPGNFDCCMDAHPKQEDKECFQPPNKPPPSCDTDTCMAKKRGLLADDGSIDKAAFESEVSKQFKDDPQLTEVIKTKCINGKLEDYGPPDFCELTKLRHCISLQTIMACKEWDDKGHCSGIKERVEECRSVV